MCKMDSRKAKAKWPSHEMIACCIKKTNLGLGKERPYSKGLYWLDIYKCLKHKKEEGFYFIGKSKQG